MLTFSSKPNLLLPFWPHPNLCSPAVGGGVGTLTLRQGGSWKASLRAQSSENCTILTGCLQLQWIALFPTLLRCLCRPGGKTIDLGLYLGLPRTPSEAVRWHSRVPWAPRSQLERAIFRSIPSGAKQKWVGCSSLPPRFFPLTLPFLIFFFRLCFREEFA